jgi:hypothetical protein
VDSSSDLEPQSPTDRAKLEKLFVRRSSANELKEKGILKGTSRSVPSSGGGLLIAR